MRERSVGMPERGRALYEELLSLAQRRGVDETKIARCPVLLSLIEIGGDDVVERRSAAALRLLRATQEQWADPWDGRLIKAGLNLSKAHSTSMEKRVRDEVVDLNHEFHTDANQDGELDRLRQVIFRNFALALFDTARALQEGIDAGWSPAGTPLELAERLQATGRVPEATGVLEDCAADPGNAKSVRLVAWGQLATIAAQRVDAAGVLVAAEEAMELLPQVDERKAFFAAIDGVALVLTHQEQYDVAVDVLKRFLNIAFDSARLWRRYGCVRWYEGLSVEAYAALSRALDLGAPRQRIVHARGQVLAELGQWSEAIQELTEAIDSPRSSMSIAYAQGARAFAIGMQGDLERATAEFALAESVVPSNAWLRYFRAICYNEHGMHDQAIEEMETALCLHVPSLTAAKRARAQQLLLEWTE